MDFFKRYACVRQHDITDCGAACLASVARHYGFKTSVAGIREMAGTDRQGTNAYGLIKAAEKLGFAAKGVKATREDFFNEFPLPAIAHVVMDKKLLHYVVVYHIGKKAVVVADPAKGIERYTPEEFFKIWTGKLVLLVPGEAFKKGDETKGVFARFFSLLKPQKRLVADIFCASLIYTLMGIGGSFYFKFLLDDILQYSLVRTLHLISIGIILLNILQILLNAFRNHLLMYLSQKLDIALILGYYRHVLRLPMRFFSTRKVGEIISRFTDASRVRDAVSGATLTIMIDTLMAIAGAVVLYMQDPFLFLIALSIVSIYAVIVFIFNKPLKDINRKQMENNAQLTSYLVESLKGIETVKAFSAEEKACAETDRGFVRLLKSIFKGGWLNNLLGSLTGLVSSVGGIVILWMGAWHVIQGRMTVGQLLVFNALLVYFLTPVKNLINLQPLMQTAIVAAERLGEILDLELEKSADEDKKARPASLKGSIEFKNVDFRYGTRALVLKNINLSVRPGESIALVGESGSGKTTLAKLLMNFYNWEKGEILINGSSIREIQLEILRRKIAYISQDIFLFSGTVKENLCLGVEDASSEEIIEAAKAANAHDFITALPLGYDALLEENGMNLSGGQQQRLAIARALLKKPDILIMDEATSNLDSITEKAVEQTMSRSGGELTTIIIAHRLSTILRCDRIYVMDKGEIAESGTHEELMGLRGKYYRLWREQVPEEQMELQKPGGFGP